MSKWVYQSSGWNPELWSPQTQYFLFLLQSAVLYHRPLNIATVPVKDGAQPLQQYHASGASHGAAGSKRTEPSKYLDYTWSLNLDLFHVKKEVFSGL